MLRLTNERTLPLMLAIFFLPLAVLYNATGLSGHFGLVLRHLEDIKRRFGEIVAQVRSSSEMVVRSTREIAEGNSNLSRRTEQQPGGPEPCTIPLSPPVKT